MDCRRAGGNAQAVSPGDESAWGDAQAADSLQLLARQVTLGLGPLRLGPQHTGFPSDRRVRMIAITPSGARVRAGLLERLSNPPAFFASLSQSEQETLRDLLKKAITTEPGAA